MENMIIVGDKFKDFARMHGNVFTTNEFGKYLWKNDLSEIDKIIIGQGVELDAISSSLSIVKQLYPNKINDIVNLDNLFYQADAEHIKTTHKKNPKNVLITRPEKFSESKFLSKLILQDSSELLSDHQTGQHIQGMVLIEAARQTMISVTEHHLMFERQHIDKYFTLTTLDVSFTHFVFPLPVDVVLNVLSEKKSTSGKYSCECRVGFEQSGIEKSSVKFVFSVYDMTYISSKEHELASSCHKVCLAV